VGVGATLAAVSMAFELLVPLALFGAFVSSSGVTWVRRARRIDEGRARARDRGWVAPIRARSTFPMDLRGDLRVHTRLSPTQLLRAFSERALDVGYEHAASERCTIAFRRGSEWRALSSFDLCDVPSELVLWLEASDPAGVTTVRCVMTYRTRAHYVSSEDLEQATEEFSAVIDALAPERATELAVPAR
jgi:hypothetical protein